jgi:hypothetical protein
MAKAFAALDDDGRRFWLGCMEREAESRRAKRRPALRLIQGGAQAEGIATPAPARSRRAKK